MFRNDKDLRRRATRPAYEELLERFPSDRDLVPAEAVESLYREELDEVKQPAHYHGFYENRIIDIGGIRVASDEGTDDVDRSRNGCPSFGWSPEWVRTPSSQDARSRRGHGVDGRNCLSHRAFWRSDQQWGILSSMTIRRAKASSGAASSRPLELSAELQSELRDAVAEIERGEALEVTLGQLETWGETGEFPWPDESLG